MARDHTSGPFDAGLVLVHGIGSQRRGSTLAKWSDAVVTWLRGWHSHDDSVSISVVDVEANPPSSEPARATLEVVTPDRTWRVLIAEAWWSETFATPSFGEFARWSFRAVPIATIAHMAGSIRQNAGQVMSANWPTRLYRAMVAALLLVLYPVVVLVGTPVVVALEVVLFVVGLIPAIAVRDFVVGVQRGLTGSVGDSLIFVESPTYATSITEAVDHSMDFVARRVGGSRRMVVVAHSQGAAVVRNAIGARSRRGSALLTFGSGIKKLHAIERDVAERALSAWGAVIALLVAGYAAAGTYVDLSADRSSLPLVAVTVAVGLFVVVAAAVVASISSKAEEGTGLPLAGRALVAMLLLVVGGAWLVAMVGNLSGEAFQPMIATLGVIFVFFILRGLLRVSDEVSPSLDARVGTWSDFWARSDPVPNGATTTDQPGWPRSCEVRNLDSPFRDHSYYVRNWDQVMPAVLTALGQRAGDPSPFPDGSSDDLRHAQAHRRWRVDWLVGSRWWIAATALFAYLRPPQGLDVLESLMPDLGTLPWAGPVLADVRASAPELNDQLRRLAVIAVCALVAYGGAYLLWTWWDVSDRRRVFAREPLTPRSGLLVLLIAYLCAIGALAIGGIDLIDEFSLGQGGSDAFGAIAVCAVALAGAAWLLSLILANRHLYLRVTGIDARNQPFSL